MADFWEGMEDDPDAIARIIKSVELLDAKDEMTVLDIGCHKHEAARYLPPKVRYCGIDIEQNHSKTIKMNIDGGFNFPEQVDRILCLEVLEHLEIPGGTLQSIFNTLTYDGIAVISLPNEATLFHRIRCLFGIVDQECFNYGGKHLHLPSLNQCRKFLKQFFQIQEEAYYVSRLAKGSKQEWLGKILSSLPPIFLTSLSYIRPSIFARGFIFKLSKK